MNSSDLPPRSILGGDRMPDRGPPLHSLLPAVPDVLDYWRRIMARKWLVLAVTLAAVVLGALVVRSMTPIYESTATLLIEGGRNEIVQIREFYTGTSGSRDHFTTQSEFLDSRNVAERVIRQFALTEHPEFDPRQQPPSLVSRLSTAIRGILPGERKATDPPPQDVLNSVVGTFSHKLDVQPLKGTQLVRVRFSSEDPALAAKLANAVVAAYIDADMDARYAVTQQAHAWLSEHVATLRRNLSASEQALQNYRESKGLLDKESTAQGGVGRQLEAITQRLVEARIRRAQAEEQYRQIRGRSVQANESVPIVMANPAVARARDLVTDAQRRMADASARFGPSHPQHQASATELRSAQAALASAVEAVVRSIAKEYEVARALEQSLEQELAESRGVIQAHNRDEFELATYEQEVSTNRQLYETFLGRLKETTLVSDAQNPIARLIDPAVAASLPAKPARTALLAVFGLTGMIFGVALAFLLHRLDDTFASVDEVEGVLGAPVLTVLPQVRGGELRNVHRMIVKYQKSGFSEAIRTARSGLRLANLDLQRTPVVMVTSSLAGEGKSTVATNLALAQARVANTLLIECDIRRPNHARLFGQPDNTPGLTDCLKKGMKPEECVFKPRGSNLDCLSAGRLRDAPLELLLSKDFGLLLDRMRLHYDMIIIDTPPVALVADGLTLAEQADGIVLTVKAHATSRRLVRRTVQRLRRVKTPIIGIVLNQLDVQRARKYYGEYGVYDIDGYGGYEHRTEPI